LATAKDQRTVMLVTMDVNRRRIRRFAAFVAALMALIYVLIGLGVLDIGASNQDAQFLWVFGAAAGGAFLLGAILLLAFDRRWLWILGVVFQLIVYWAYVDVARNRTPPFEVWGVTLRLIQLPLLGALVYLAVRVPRPTAGMPPRAPGGGELQATSKP
jgi:hypothetical protein